MRVCILSLVSSGSSPLHGSQYWSIGLPIAYNLLYDSLILFNPLALLLDLGFTPYTVEPLKDFPCPEDKTPLIPLFMHLTLSSPKVFAHHSLSFNFTNIIFILTPHIKCKLGKDRHSAPLTMQENWVVRRLRYIISLGKHSKL